MCCIVSWLVVYFRQHIQIGLEAECTDVVTLDTCVYTINVTLWFYKITLGKVVLNMLRCFVFVYDTDFNQTEAISVSHTFTYNVVYCCNILATLT